ncbi:MAG: HAMP domain-containing sensor histidine kinase [Oceanicoccus sp.]|uniref:sensor histidine kinase n=1 Tax=Oceanicoccus sp. TaxID=2691044 RepID=UPI00263849F9|nr:HAMP domain-containing sensor histidine kinase [Oceanicoccus sp.]MDG1773727.1 HAMP domain-containing sensor histidine kinase [Oceanicoccus sp.]
MSTPEHSEENGIDFSMLLASSVHDIKNSLSMLLTSLDEVIDITTEERPEQRKSYSILRGEASRINNALIYLLGLYRLQNEQLSLNLQEVFIADFLEEQLENQKLLFDVNNIDVVIDCDENLTGYFDENLIAGVINNILVNCAKYTKDTITLSAQQQDNYLTISINDNGSGYPQHIIDHISNDNRGIDFNSSSTNLGLFFSQQIASIHQCKGRSGSIELSNPEQGGGCFRLILP